MDKISVPTKIRSALSKLDGEILTGLHMLAILFIVQNCDYESGVLMSNNGKYLGYKDLSKECNISLEDAKRTMKELSNKYMLYHSNGKYFVNPFIFKYSVELNETIYAMFEYTKWNK